MSKTNYIDLITSEYRDKPKFIAWVKVLLKPLEDIQEASMVIKNCLNINESTGDQLDIIGLILGVPRQLNFQPDGGISPILDDYYYRMVLRAKVAQNQWKGTYESILDYWSILFPDLRLSLRDNQNMTIQVSVLGNEDTLVRDLILNGYLIPKPAGVGLIYVVTDPDDTFGFKQSNLNTFDNGTFFTLT